jgi:hypothetical protein
MIEVGLLEKREDNSNPLKKKIWYTIKDQASVKIQKKINKSSDTKTPPVKKMFTYRTDVRHVPNHGSPPPIPPIKESIYINKINKDLIASNNTRAIPPNLEELPAKSLHDLLPQTKGIMNPERPVLTVQNSKREMLTVDEHKVRDYCLRQGFSQQIVSYAIEQLRKIKRPVNSIFTLAATICSRYRKDLKEQKQNEQQFEAKAHKTENSVAKNSIPKETIMENDRTRAINSMINKTVKEQRLKELESRKGSALLGPQIEKQFFHAVEMAKPPIEKALLLTVEEKKKRMAEALKQLEELKRLNNPPEETPIAQVVAQAPIEIGDYHEKPEWAENFL